AGMMLGGLLHPPKGPTVDGPRLNDLSVQTSTYGAVIPRVYGAITVDGNVFWLENNSIKETITKKKSGGKGGGAKTTTRTYSYSATFAVGLCKGPVVGLRRLWVGADLIYDAGSSDPDTILGSNQAATGFKFYTGSDTQQPDARMQATLGVANTPAWRGLCYLVLYDFPLAKYGNSLLGAQVRAEVLQLGATYSYVATRHDMPVQQQWQLTAWSGSVFVRVAFFSTSVWVSSDAITWTEYANRFPASQSWYGLSWGNGCFVLSSSSTPNGVWRSTDGITWTTASLPAGGTPLESAFGNGIFAIVTDSGHVYRSLDGTNWTKHDLPYNNQYAHILHNGSVFMIWQMFANKVMTSSDGINWTGGTPGGLPFNQHGWGVVKGGQFLVFASSTAPSKRSSDGLNWVDTTSVPYNQGFCADDKNWICFGNSGFAVSSDGYNWTDYPNSLISSGPYKAAAWNGGVISVCNTMSALAYTIQPTFVSALPTTVGAIVSAECLQSGLLAAGDIDVSALTSGVYGYRVASVGAIRAALEPLQAAWPFDVVQRGYVIRFVARGGSSVVTIPQADLDARRAGASAGIQITTSREMDSQIPRKVTVQYLDLDREYNVGLQYAERLNTAAINAIVLDLPIVMTATDAAGKAEVLLYVYWLERYDVSINLPPNYHQLEPGDVVTLVTPEGNVSLRLTTVDYTSDGRVECRAKYANAAVYTPTAVGASPAVTGPTTVNPIGASTYVLLDVPLIHSAQSGPSFLAAMTSAAAGWSGGALMQSTDAGSTWAVIHDFGAPGSAIGMCTNSIGASDPRVIDNGSVLNVTLTQGALYSVTQLAMLNGANVFAYGADGRWEIIAAQTCTLVSGNNYTLRDLLRGRFGTEWAMSLHAAGDSLVLLDTTDVAAIAMSAGSIGLSYLYRGITVNRDLGTDSNRTFAYRGVNLKPLSPIALTGNRDAGNDWTLTWIRRTRDGGEWRDYVDASLGEAAESYAIDVYADGSYTSVKRTITASSPSCFYASADQVADFGANQATLYLKLYQLSATVGRGYPLTQSITR
uniref:phage tail protein n=1 Tax=Accumulibacter sp. TaxID=2053492 RepID=UPI0035B1ED2C